MNTATSASPAFEVEFERAVQRLRGSLTELYASVGANAGAPQDVARRFGINRNLSWKLGKVIHSSDVLEAFPHLPGSGALELVLEAFARENAPKGIKQRVLEAHEHYESVVKRHAGDRATLELMVRNFGTGSAAGPQSEEDRKLSFRGNSAIWGVQARVRMLTQIIAPNKDEPLLIDNAMIGGVFDYRRLRSGVRWPLGQRVIHFEHGELKTARVEPIDPNAEDPEGLPLMRDFCSTPTPELMTVHEGDFSVTELKDGPVGKTGSLSCVFGWIHRAYTPVYAGETGDRYGEHALRLDTPCEVGMMDLLLHRDLPYEAPKLCLYSLMHGQMQYPPCEQTRHHLPCGEPVIELGSGPPVLATPHVRNYPEMVGFASERLGHDLSEFRGYRVTLTYPPIPTMADFYYPLPTKPE